MAIFENMTLCLIAWCVRGGLALRHEITFLNILGSSGTCVILRCKTDLYKVILDVLFAYCYDLFVGNMMYVFAHFLVYL